MMPYMSFPYRRRGYYNRPKPETEPEPEPVKEETRNSDAEPQVLELFGLKLNFDDLLIIGILFFLYNEGVKDPALFISLILLLIT